jgi:transposase InsO family protein
MGDTRRALWEDRMPWKVSKPMDERMKFIGRLLAGEKMTDLCTEFGISRKTGHKFLARYEAFGPEGLVDRSRAPRRQARQTANELERLVVDLRAVHPTWGPKKLKERLETLHPGIKFPAASTIGDILVRFGLIADRRRRPIEERFTGKNLGLTVSDRPNDVWCTDFKGEFRLSNGQYCYPLTTSDFACRYLLGSDALASTQAAPARVSFEALFEEFGLPLVMRSDSGTPFSARGYGGLSELSAYWMSLGIRPERTQPAHPEQNGRHERMHRVMKAEATRPASPHLMHQQERLDEFRRIYNEERPHEALEQKTPASLYEKSPRSLAEAQRLSDSYPMHDYTRLVSGSGTITISGKAIFLATALRGLTVGLRDLGEGVFLIGLGPFDLGYADLKTRKLVPDHPDSDEETETENM